jgi:hypothetical protein
MHVDQVTDLLATELRIDSDETELFVDVVVVARSPDAQVGLGVAGEVTIVAVYARSGLVSKLQNLFFYVTGAATKKPASACHKFFCRLV